MLTPVRANAGRRATTANVTMTTASTEYSHTLVRGTKAFSAKLRSSTAVFKLNIGQTATLSGTTYITVPAGADYSASGLLTESGEKLFFQSASASQTMEIVSWF